MYTRVSDRSQTATHKYPEAKIALPYWYQIVKQPLSLSLSQPKFSELSSAALRDNGIFYK
jgi:hypothetical protein